MPDWRFQREARTPHSEQWAIETEQYSIGRVDLHFTSSRTFGTIALHHSVAEEDIEELIAEVDERLVLTADPDREDFVVTVWRGESYGTFSEDTDSEETDAATTEPPADGEASEANQANEA
jgi:hypothetical protein